MSRLVKIKWDTNDISPEELNLPYQVEVPDVIDKDEIADWLSDEYGYCIESLEYE